MIDSKKVKIQNFIESQIPEFLNSDNPLFKEFLEQYYISQEHPTGTTDLANNFIDYKKISSFNAETFLSQKYTYILESDLQSFDTTINVSLKDDTGNIITDNTTFGFPDRYGLLKIDNEIITYTSKTNNTFEGCIRGFSGIDNIKTSSFYDNFNFRTTNADFHISGSIINNLNLLFFGEIFKKFRYQFLPGFENRTLVDELNLQTILTRAKDYYTSKGTDTSYKILFKILYDEDVEVIKPQDYLLRPSASTIFITKNILVEKISGDLDPLEIQTRKETIAESVTLFQNTPNGLASASIYNVEIRPIDGRFLYEISLDPDSFILNFISTKKTNLLEDSIENQKAITVDSTVGFPQSGELLVRSVNAPSDFFIKYNDKTINQFLDISGNTVKLSKGDILVENNFVYASLDGKFAYFRIINVIGEIDSNNTSNLRVGDKINLSSFGLELNNKTEFNSWIYNIPTKHKIKTISRTESSWRIELLDQVNFTIDESLLFLNQDSVDSVEIFGFVRRIIDNKTIEVTCGEDISNKTILSKIIEKSNVLLYPSANSLASNIQNTYIDQEEKNFYSASSGLPSYRVVSDNRKILISTPQNPNPFIGIGYTTILNTNIKHKFYTGEQIYLTPSETLGISTGVYYIKALGTYSDSQQISLSYSNTDIFSNKHINVSYGSTGEFVKLDYENKDLKHQKLLRKFPLPHEEYKPLTDGERDTNNKPVGLLINGVEIYSPTLYDENIYYGKLDNIKILKTGDGYDVINSPEIEISDTINGVTYGKGAKAHANISGSVKGIKIVNPGFGYDKNVNISISGGNGYGASLEANVIKTRTTSGFRGDGTGINPTDNSIAFVFPHNFEDGEIIEYFSNGNREIEYSDPVTVSIRKIPSNSFYFAGVFSDTVIKLYRTKEDAANRQNEINLTTSPSSGFHYFKSLDSKFSLVNVFVKEGGTNYSNKKIIIDSVEDNIGNQNGINIVDNYIFAKNHNFKDKDLVVYTTSGAVIAGVSTENYYYVKVLDNNRFKLSLAKTSNTELSDENYVKEKYVRLNSVGAGKHIFSYPPIKISIEASPESSNGKLSLPVLEPIILGGMDSIFVEEYGNSYGSNNIINFHRRPSVVIRKESSIAIFKPIIVDGYIAEVQILNYGNGYGKDVDLIIDGKGKFADLYPVVENGRVISVIILNSGIGYDENTTIRIVKRGNGVQFQGNIFEWKINQVEKNKFILQNEDEGILVPSKNQQTGLQFVHFYPPKTLRKKINDNLDFLNKEEISLRLSPIIGWSYDGFPIYGPYSTVDGQINRIRTSYRQIIERNSNLRPTGSDFPDGFFIQDYIFDKESGDLDEYNGRYIKNKDFPNGTYAYYFTIDIDNDKNSIPQYPYVISNEFKRVPELENYNPRFNQDLDLNELNLIRNVSPYYLNSNTSFYELLDNVESKYKQEFRVRTTSSSGLDDVIVYDSGDGYKVGDILDFRSGGTQGSGANGTVSSVIGKNIKESIVGITTIYPVRFVRIGSNIVGISDMPLDFINGESVNISDVSNSSYKFIEGNKTALISTKFVGIITNILGIDNTGNITEIYPTDINGFEVSDYIKIDNEILKILQVRPLSSSFVVERISNSGVHTSGISTISLLPRKFEFDAHSKQITSIENKIVYFNPETEISENVEDKEYALNASVSIIIPPKSIYIPNHQYTTGQPVKYNCGVGGTGLYVYDYPGNDVYQLSNNQILYVVNNGKDFIGISTISIGSTDTSLYFDSNTSGVGIAHSLTTTYTEVYGKVENYSVTIETNENHNLLDNDIVQLNFTPQNIETIVFRYDPIIRKITTGLINFDSSLVDANTSEIVIDEDFISGEKVVYYNNGDADIGGLENNKTYYIIKENPGRIKLSEYYSDSISGIGITLNSSSSEEHSLARVNPPLTITDGSYIIFDTSDNSLNGLFLRLYKDISFKDELETYKYISNSGDRYLDTLLNVYPKEIYYSFCSLTRPVCPDFEVKNNNFIQFVKSDYFNEYKISNINDNKFRINLQRKPNIILNSSSDIKYTTTSKNATGPINKVKINYKGKGYKQIPKVNQILSSSGKGAIIKAKSNKIGKVSSLDRVKDGFDYPTDSTLLPLLSTPAIVQVEGISRVDYVGIVTGGRNYNKPPILKVIGNDNIKLEAVLQGTSIVDVRISQNTNNLDKPLRIVPVKNTNGYSIDDITVNGNLVTLELLNSDVQLYPLITSDYGSVEVVFPFEVGDKIFVERCRISLSERDNNGILISKDNFNSSDYNYSFFTIVSVNEENYTITYSMDGVKEGLNLGDYTSDFGYGYVVNEKDMVDLEMFIVNDLSYISNETVVGFNQRGTNTFSAKVMEGGWDNDTNELRLIDVKGVLNNGDTIQGKVSLLNGKITDINTFNLKTSLSVVRDELNDFMDNVGFLNDSQQRISDNNYYQKFSYSIRGKVPYNIWKEPVKSLIHPSGFKEFSDLLVESSSEATMKVGTASSVDFTVNIDNNQSLYTKNNFAMVTEDEQFEDGSIERILFEDGIVLRPYILSKTNRVIQIDDISSQFDGTSTFEVIANKPVTFISTEVYTLGVSTEGLSIGDKIGFSTYHFYPDSTYILGIGENFIELSRDTPHKLYSISGVSTSVTQNLDFSRRVLGAKNIGRKSFKLTNNGNSLFYKEFDASNGITTSVNLETNTFIVPDHNFQTGQRVFYTPAAKPNFAVVSTTFDSSFSYTIDKTFDTEAYTFDNNETSIITFDYDD